MVNIGITKNVLDVLVLLNTAVKNARMYPPTSASVVQSVEKLLLSLLTIINQEEQIIFAESEKDLLISDQSLSHKDQEMPHIISMLNMLLGFGLKSITFSKGLEKEELGRFIGLISRKPESVNNEGGIIKLFADKNISHIHLDQKVYVAMDKDHQILSNLDITDDQITRFFMMTHPEMDRNSQQFKEMTRDPKTLSQAFEAGLSKIMAQKETVSSVQLSESLNNMLVLLDKLTDSFTGDDRNKMSQTISKSIAASDPEVARQLTTQNIKNLFGGLLLPYLIDELTQNKLGVAGSGEDKETPGREAASDDSKNKLLQIAEKFSLRLQDTGTLLDEGLMAVLPKIIEQLIAQKEQEAMENMLQHLITNLASENIDVRLSAARSLADIIEHLPGERKNEIIEKLSDKLIAWLKSENIFSPEYQRICIILKNVTQDHIAQKQFSKALKYLDAFNAVACNAVGKPDTIKNVSVKIIDQLASSENIDILLHEIDLPENKNREDTWRVVASLGNAAFDDLLNQLREVTDSDKRVRIMHLIASAGEKALPLIIGRITKEAPWFYLRNLAYLLGQIGNEETAPALAPLLLHRNEKLRHEALKSIYRTGGKQRGKILLAALPHADEEFKSSIVEVLGQSKIAEAVPFLIDLLKNKPLITSAARTNLEEKICLALGIIGSPDAIPPLSEITATKSFLGLRTYPDKVKAAAARSLTTLQSKIKEFSPRVT